MRTIKKKTFPPGREPWRFVALPTKERKRRQRLFLEAYERTRGVKRAAALAGVAWQRHYDWLGGDAKYRAAFARVRLALAEAAERAVLRRAGGPPRTEAELMGVLRRLARLGAGLRRPGKRSARSE